MFTHNFTSIDFKNQNCLISYVQNYFNQTSIGLKPSTPSEVILKEFYILHPRAHAAQSCAETKWSKTGYT